MFDFTPDTLVIDNERYDYRNGTWTNTNGMVVSLTRSQRMTMDFFAIHGRAPKVEPKPKRRTARSRAKKATMLRAAIAKAVRK